MAIYVDEPRTYNTTLRWKKWAHLTADSEAELIVFAKRLGLKIEWAQRFGTRYFHFDVTESKRRLALKYGAQAVNAREMGNILRQRHAEEGNDAAKG